MSAPSSARRACRARSGPRCAAGRASARTCSRRGSARHLRQGIVPPVDGDLLGGLPGDAAHEDAAGDRFVEQAGEHHAVGSQLVPVAGDARRPVGSGVPLVGLVVDDDEAVGRAHEQVDVPLEHGVAELGDDEQLAPVLGAAGRGGDDRCREGGPTERAATRSSSPKMPSAAHCAAARSSMSSPVRRSASCRTPCTARPTAVP